jgi:5-methylcytosine-specific restriction endonuclease McrA
MNVTKAAKRMGLSRAQYLNERDTAQERVFKIKQELYSSYLSSDQWRKKQKAILARDCTCRLCKGSKAIEVHHLTYASVFRESQYDLIGLCKGCHRKLHLLGIPHWGGIEDVQGRA